MHAPKETYNASEQYRAEAETYATAIRIPPQRALGTTVPDSTRPGCWQPPHGQAGSWACRCVPTGHVPALVASWSGGPMLVYIRSSGPRSRLQCTRPCPRSPPTVLLHCLTQLPGERGRARHGNMHGTLRMPGMADQHWRRSRMRPRQHNDWSWGVPVRQDRERRTRRRMRYTLCGLTCSRVSELSSMYVCACGQPASLTCAAILHTT